MAGGPEADAESGFAEWLESARRHPVIVVIGLLLSAGALVATIGTFIIDLQSSETVVELNGDRAASVTPLADPAQPLDDLAIARRVIIQNGDLGPGWSSFTRRSREEVAADYGAVESCAAFVPVIRGDGETASAGHDVAYFQANQAVSATVTFYESEQLATERGPALLLDIGYQTCRRDRAVRSIADTNDTAENIDVASSELPAPSYGDRSEALQVVADFTIPQLGDLEQFTDEYAIQIGRAVLIMNWSGDIDLDPRSLQLLQTLAQRFERDMALYGG